MSFKLSFRACARFDASAGGNAMQTRKCRMNAGETSCRSDLLQARRAGIERRLGSASIGHFGLLLRGSKAPFDCSEGEMVLTV
jgi:hypothetical protein